MGVDVAAKAADLINWIATPLGTRLAMTWDGGRVAVAVQTSPVRFQKKDKS